MRFESREGDPSLLPFRPGIPPAHWLKMACSESLVATAPCMYAERIPFGFVWELCRLEEAEG